MIVECPECGTQNQTDKPPQPDKRYRCGKCGAVITYLQTIDTLSEMTSVTATQETGESAVTPKESRESNWSVAQPTGRKKGLISKARTGTGRSIQVIGWIIFIVTGLVAFIWELWALSIAFGAWTILVALLFAPITYLAAIFIVWFSTGVFPIIIFIFWLASWLGAGIVALGGRVGGEDWGSY